MAIVREMSGAQDPKWLAYLFRQHSEAELTEWMRELRFFRYIRALGGHANDGDMFLAALRCANHEDLPRLLTALRLSASGHVQIAGAKVFVYWQTHEQKLELHVSGAAGNPHEVTRADVDDALRIEQYLEPLASHIVVPPRVGQHCFSPAVQ